MAGRKRKMCKRHPNGQAVAYVPVNMEKQIVHAQRLASVAHVLASKDVTGTPAGLLYVQQFLTEEEFNADLQFAILVRRYAFVRGINLAPPKVVSFGIASGHGTAYEPDEDEIAAVKNRYAAAHAALSDAGKAAMKEVNNCSVYQGECHDRHAYKRGLHALAELFKLSDALTPGQEKRRAMRAKMKSGARPVIGILG